MEQSYVVACNSSLLLAEEASSGWSISLPSFIAMTDAGGLAGDADESIPAACAGQNLWTVLELE